MPETGRRAALDIDRYNRDWYIDKMVQVLVFLGGISAIVFIIGIFVFITREGFGFLVGDFSFREFFLSPNWRPTSSNPTYGILALVAGTASVTGLAMLVAIPFSLGAAIFIGEFAARRGHFYRRIRHR
jgi:phosphate transport system permease protein